MEAYIVDVVLGVLLVLSHVDNRRRQGRMSSKIDHTREEVEERIGSVSNKAERWRNALKTELTEHKRSRLH